MASPAWLRRQELAREQGYSSYSQKRRARNALLHNPTIQTAFETDTQIKYSEEVEESGLSEQEIYAAWFLAFADRKTRWDNSRSGPKARWFVEIVGKVASYDEWDRKYARN